MLRSVRFSTRGHPGVRPAQRATTEKASLQVAQSYVHMRTRSPRKLRISTRVSLLVMATLMGK